MAHPLDGPRLKVARAREHLDALDREVRAFSDSKPYELISEVDPETGDYVYRLHLNWPGARPPDHLSLIAGDIVHNLRTSLDYVVWQLAELGRGANFTIQFPLIENPDQQKYREMETNLLDPILARHRALIKGLQPYHVHLAIEAGAAIPSPNQALLLVGRLDNWDKHRLLLPTHSLVAFKPPTFRNLRTAQVHSRAQWFGMKEGTELFRITDIEAQDPNAKVEVESRLPYSINFGDPTVPPETVPKGRDQVVASWYDLELITDQVSAVVESFAPEFP